ncbi:hypothetical protein DFJ77DRAFT_449260 [Powellomyces hirtus]|nr:hypothetical protein DFJ77DRAFT_449260 [Powellomyces hirtus]
MCPSAVLGCACLYALILQFKVIRKEVVLATSAVRFSLFRMSSRFNQQTPHTCHVRLVSFLGCFFACMHKTLEVDWITLGT